MEFFGIDLVSLIKTVGYVGIFFIVFAETGLFLGFFLPGDSLLFIAGLLAKQGFFSLSVLVFGLFVSAVLGNLFGYEFGRRIGPKLFSREDSLIFKKAHALKAQSFYDKHGPKTILLARFMPIVRTFAPIVAGRGSQYAVSGVFSVQSDWRSCVGHRAGSFGIFLGERDGCRQISPADHSRHCLPLFLTGDYRLYPRETAVNNFMKYI